MTVETRLLQAYATLRSIQGDLEVLAAKHPDQGARGSFEREARRTGKMLDTLGGRIDEIRREEKQYGSVTASGGDPDKPHPQGKE